jgi:phosphoribosylanthranilate isomerase
MSEEADLEASARRYPDARALLLDVFDPVRFGGTGRAFDRRRVPARRSAPIVLAGGLDAENVARAIAEVGPDAVDVCGGVEAAPGIKDRDRMRAFVAAVSDAEEHEPCAS